MVAKNGKTGSPYEASFAKFFDAFAAPKFDLDAITSLQQRNLDALTEVNRIATEGFQAMAKRQFEMVRDALDESAKAAQKLAAAKPEARFDESAKLARTAIDKCLCDCQELADLAVKSQTETFEKLSAAYLGAFDGLQTATAQPEKPAAK